ncbi:hypothetical protein [Nocardia aobensis]|uniref:hypothetical protein n=1 Tax=Nocardia aobensis TaxID=257277 RepID=UPI0002F78C1E|nr:hypothetical protein [Nocardia aobensis]
MSFLGLSLKDVVVGAVSAIPVVGAVAGAATDGIWTGIETGSVTDGLKAAAITGALAAVPGGKIGSMFGEKLLAKGLLGKGVGLIGKIPLKTVKNVAARGGGKGLQRSLGRAVLRGAGGTLGSAIYNPEADAGAPKIKAIPVRPAGADLSGNNFRDSAAAALNYQGGTVAQQPAAASGITQQPAPDATPRAVPV